MSDLKMRMILSLIFMLLQIVAAGINRESATDLVILQGLLLIPLIIVNYRCYVDAFLSVRTRHPEKNLLAALGSICAIAAMLFPAAGLVLTTMAVCRYLEQYIGIRLQDHLIRLIDSEPEDEGISEGQILTVSSGEIIPADGVVLSGETVVDEEVITGERVPARKRAGEVAFAGTRNLAYDISMRISHTGEKRTISRLIEHIGRAITTPSSLMRRADRIARRFTAVVIAVAVVVVLLRCFAGEDTDTALLAGIAILIAANPYAFSVAAPMTVLAAVIRGAQNGILIRSGEILEETRDINTVIINKRGTITAGEPEISDVIPLENGFDLGLAGSLEWDAEHPFGRKIYQEALKEYPDLPHGETVEYIPARGLRSLFKGEEYLIGNAIFMEENSIRIESGQVDDLFRQGKSLVFFARARKLIGIIAFRDVTSPTSLKAITLIEEMGIDVAMLTGDSRQTANAIRREVGIDHVFADVLPSEKKDIVETLRREKKKTVAMVGDGLQDAPALEAADLSIAIGTGRDIYIGPADIVLVSNDLLDVIRAIRLSRLTSRNLRQSNAFAYIYNGLAILAAAGLTSVIAGVDLAPIAAAVSMCISQVLVTLNSLRIRRVLL